MKTCDLGVNKAKCVLCSTLARQSGVARWPYWHKQVDEVVGSLFEWWDCGGVHTSPTSATGMIFVRCVAEVQVTRAYPAQVMLVMAPGLMGSVA